MTGKRRSKKTSKLEKDIFSPAQLEEASNIGRLAYANPFLEERISLEKKILKDRYVDISPVWRAEVGLVGHNDNIHAICAGARGLAEKARSRLASGTLEPSKRHLDAYEELALYVLFYEYEERFWEHIIAGRREGKEGRFDFYREFVRDVESFFERVPKKEELSCAHLFAVFFQLRRAFHYTFRHILGGSMAAARLRAAVWRSIFTRDLRLYRRSLFDRMHEPATLITGPSGTGKELVASAVGLSRFIPFDEGTMRFQEGFETLFQAVNPAALSPTLVESELFGHKKGAFTGAVADRRGYLDVGSSMHTVFLDEVAEIPLDIQVKLLRVLQSREFNRLGDPKTRRFGGKIVAATNRDLGRETNAGGFRKDLYYRLCSDRVCTPSLVEQLEDSPGELESLVEMIAVRIIPGDQGAASALTSAVCDWIRKEIPSSYPWPGNMRELEQCVFNCMISGEYHPLGGEGDGAALDDELSRCELTADELLNRYCASTLERTGSYSEAARILGLDRRTVKARASEGSDG